MKRFYLALLLSVTTATATAGKDWRGLRPLVSTRLEVERLLGAPKTPGGSSYESRDENIDIHYSTGVCGDANTWRVPRDTVISITVKPRTRALTPEVIFRELQIEPNAFEEAFSDDGQKQFWNADEGVFLNVSGAQETVTEIIYMPRKTDEYARCPGYPKPEPPRCLTPTTVEIDGPSGPVSPGTQIILQTYVIMKGISPETMKPLTYHWKISAGKFTSGEDPSKITVSTTGLENQSLRVTVEVEGLPMACPNTATYKLLVAAAVK